MEVKKKIGFIIKERGKNSRLSFETSFVHLILKEVAEPESVAWEAKEVPSIRHQRQHELSQGKGEGSCAW